MREDLERYNAFVLKHKISLRLNGETIVDNRFLIDEIYRYIHNGKVWIKEIQLYPGNHITNTNTLPIPSYTRHLNKFINNPRYYINNILDTVINPSSITQMKRDKSLLRVLLRRFWSDEHRFEKYLAKRNDEIHRIPIDERQDILPGHHLLQTHWTRKSE